ncbi:hypothetical protein QQ045_021742 [Rhodiola kirilowii]
MESGSIVNKWMLEFAISDLKDDGLITKMLSDVPPMLKDDVGLKKIILLRAIESEVAEFSVSEKTLDALEIAFELDWKEGELNALESMKTAYCSVAVDCLARVVKIAGEGEMYLDAVKRIWRKRIGQLFAHNVDLVSEQLETWRDNIETAIWDNNLRSKLFGSDTRYEALVSIKEYLNEAWETVGPKFMSRTLGKSLVEAQLLCLQRSSEPGKAEALRSFHTPRGLGDSYNPTAQYEGKVLKGPRDPSSLVSSPLLKNKDKESLANTLNQNQGNNSKNISGNKPKEGSAFHSTNTVNLCQDGIVRLTVSGSVKEQNLLQTSVGLIQDQLENVEPVLVKGKVVEEAASPLHIHGVCASNSCDHVDHVKGASISVDKEKKADLPHEVSRKVGVRRKQVGGPRKLSKRVRINDSEDVDPEGSNRQHNSLSEMEVIKVHEEFKTSSRELKDVVKDPLPDALHAVEAVLSDSARNCVPQDALAGSISDTDTLKSCGDEVERGKDEALTSHLNEARTSGMEGNTMNLKNNQGYETDPIDVTNNVSSPVAVDHVDNNLQNERSRHENLQRRANLWERNASAQIYEVRYTCFVMFFL